MKVRVFIGCVCLPRRVSTVVHLPDGRVLSGGGDGKVCLWPAGRGTQCHDLDGHASAVAKVQAVAESGRLAMSAGYDGKVRERGTTSRPPGSLWRGRERARDRQCSGLSHVCVAGRSSYGTRRPVGC